MPGDHEQDVNRFLYQAGRWLLIIGAMLFSVFWQLALFEVEGPWAITLGLHGLSSLAVAVGLILHQRLPETRVSLLSLIGVLLTVVGTLASFVVLALGLTLIAISLWIDVGSRVPPVMLIAGSVVLAVSYVLGARVGTEGVPDPSIPAAVLFGTATLLIPIGLILTAIETGYRSKGRA